MKKARELLLIVVLLIFTSGCTKDYYPVIQAAADGLPQTTQYVTDASVSKESVVHASLQNRDYQYRMAYESSGVKMTWKEHQMKVSLPGMGEPYEFTQMLPEIEFREAPRFDQPLPTRPSEHPAWRVADNLLAKGLFAFLGWQAAEVLQGAQGASTYNGPYAPNYQNPTNTGDGTVVFTPGMLNRDEGYHPVEVPVFAPMPSEAVSP